MRHFHQALGALFLVAGSSILIAAPAGRPIDFSRDIRPILSENCFRCHGPDEEHREAKLRLDLRESAFRERDGYPAFTPGNLDESETWFRLTTEDKDEVMPPPKSKKSLTSEEKELIREWIVQGAPWNSHWSFEPPTKAPLPPGANPIDHFIGKALVEKGLGFAPRANARTLVRRLSFDLTGLPPSLDDLAKLQVDSPAFDVEAGINRYLASPQFGERMAAMWLDAARYGDTSVMHADGPRDMWAWRDWVVRAFNENKPFNEFGIEQLAGDLLPEASVDQLIASGFNRNHATSDEGGAIAEELRVEYVADRVRTTANVFMGLTMECAQCHDHKYDPITQREYYRFFAYFNNHTDPGMQTRNGNQTPVVPVVSPTDGERLRQVRAQLHDADETVRKARAEGDEALQQWLKQSGPGGAAEPEGLKHLFALDGGKRDVEIDLVAGKVGVYDGPNKGENPRDDGRQGVYLDGQTSIAFHDFPDYELKNKPFSMTAWIKVPNNAGGAVFSDMDVSANYRGWDMWLQGGSVGTHIISAWPNNAIKVVSQEKLEPDRWQHVAITYDGKGTAEGVAIYLNGGSATNTVEAAKVTGSTKSKAPFRIGSRSSNANITGSVDDIRIYERVLSEEEVALVANDPVRNARATPVEKRSADQVKILTEYYYAFEHGAYREAIATKFKAQNEEKQLTAGKSTSMIMADNPPERMRKTFILQRGAYDAPQTEEVITPGTPAVLPALPADAPPNRLTLAKWFFTDEHPLTSRVAVNMIWQAFFGTGLVATPGDFGAQGAYPTHPELLDWLAVDFRENGWDVKRLARQILNSRTYQQSSRRNPEIAAQDPENHLLARAPRFRLQAEFVRDNALAISGLLNPAMGGPGVKPYQPPGLWAQVGLGGNPKFTQDHGDKLYRRSIYTYWKRSAPAPNMQIFDAPTREICAMKRPRTNTPLQALVTMNDTQFVEAARMLAERMMKEGGATVESRNAHGFELATARPPNELERNAMAKVYESALAKYLAEPAKATELLKVGEAQRDEALPLAEHAAMTVVANLILNLDETLTRE